MSAEERVFYQKHAGKFDRRMESEEFARQMACCSEDRSQPRLCAPPARPKASESEIWRSDIKRKRMMSRKVSLLLVPLCLAVVCSVTASASCADMGTAFLEVEVQSCETARASFDKAVAEDRQSETTKTMPRPSWESLAAMREAAERAVVVAAKVLRFRGVSHRAYPDLVEAGSLLSRPNRSVS